VTGPKSYKLHDLATYVRDGLTIATGLTLILSGFWYVVLMLWGPVIANHARETLGIDQLATHADVQAMALQLDTLTSRVDSLSGEERIARVDLLRSFVKSPVRPGGNVDAVIFAMRTERGSKCILTRASSVFETEGGLRVPGPVRDAASQLPTTMTRLQFSYAPPDLPPGRTKVWMVGTYECPWGLAVEEHGPLIFQMEGA
jgi:hypothetical protein